MYCGRATMPSRRWFGMVYAPVCVWCVGRWRADNDALVTLSRVWMRRYLDTVGEVPLLAHDIREALGADAFTPTAEASR